MTLEFLPDYRRWQRVHDDLWTYSADITVGFANPGRRTVAVRRAGRQWILFSPVVLDASACAELSEQGDVEAVVAPTAFHNRGVAETCREFPRATPYLTRGARRDGIDRERRKRLPADLPQEWTEELSPILLEGMPRVNEVVFLHAASRTLIVSDLCMNFDRRYSPGTKILFGISGAYPGLRSSRLFRLAIRDRAAFRQSLDRVLALDFDRVIMSHGLPIETGGKAALTALYA